MKKAITFLAAFSMSLSLLAGCAGSGSGNTEKATQAVTPAETEASEKTEKMTDAPKETDKSTEVPKETETAKETETQPATDETAEDMSETAAKAGTESELETEALNKTDAEGKVRVMALKGPTAMGMVKLMEDSEAGAVNGNEYDFTIAASVDEVTPKLVQGEADIAAVPANLASVLYNNTKGKVQVLAVNTLGVLYIVENGEAVQSVEDLKGKTVYASGKGATPEYALNYILQENGIDPQKDVTIEWKSEHSECVAALAADEDGIAMLPQPFVTTAQAKNDKIRIALDLTAEWDKLQQGGGREVMPSALITGVVVVRTDFAQEHKAWVDAFMDSYKDSVEYVNSNTDEAASLIEKYDIVPAAVAKKALPYCNITFIEGGELKEKLSGYLNVLMEQNPKAVGGELPSDDFYYSR
ncbi:ABC transporter substrate-binding protein [Murimonas intestini]|uniref:NitT/TauT family transport system substrate-binding protein n=1 Tax=Murimonas intestini TaxID=1337051 RepID=A0AB73T9C5_9FIRM|nr:PhnD/SsuA/transferrin family substrate-binding protein [Murimonas intestini]MCR1839374.1 PhnD/SsuA/transferrin family substrate-binding protein [Murimonas intestini]MCR1864669.1 PhnD/SsuA/transferrin family substrate-binding protein [Murimonas intestini]MCR1882279.1 PhnD/SsuA/transferrin family substrate-binding protein [Murimonas intestini]